MGLFDLINSVLIILREPHASHSLNHKHEVRSIGQRSPPIIHGICKLNPNKPWNIKFLTVGKPRQHISDIAIQICCIVFRVESDPEEIVRDVIKNLELCS